MKTLTHLMLAATFMVWAFSTTADAGCSSKRVSGENKPVPAAGLNQALLDKLIIDQVNLERCRRGLSVLQLNTGLRTQAANHSKWMAQSQTLSHKARSGSAKRLKDRLRKSGVRFRTGAENIGMVPLYNIARKRFLIRSSSACQFTSTNGHTLGRHSYRSLANLIVREWMASSGHRKNILSRKMRFAGSGAAVQPRAKHCGAVFLTQIFAG